MKRIVCLLLMLILLPGCVLCEPAQKLVSCYYISTASLLALGCRDRLTGIEKKGDTRPLYRLCAPEILDLPAVGSGKEVNLEQILALDPDLVILPAKLQDEADRLSGLGVYTLTVEPESEEALQACILQLGEETGCSQVAEELIARYTVLNNSLAEKLSPAAPVSTYIAAESDFCTTYPAGMYQHELLSRAGGINVAGDLSGNAKVHVDPEQLLVWDPEVIILVSGAGYTVEDVLNDPQLAGLRAVRERRVYAMPDGIESWDYPTPSSALGAYWIASVLHPDLVSAQETADTAIAFYQDVYGFTPTLQDLGMEY